MRAYCDDEHDVSDTVFASISHGFGHANKEHKPFCSVECRVWWRRRESDQPGAWEQPMKPGYQGRLDEFGGEHDDAPSATASPATTGRQVATDGGRVEDDESGESGAQSNESSDEGSGPGEPHDSHKDGEDTGSDDASNGPVDSIRQTATNHGH